MTNIITIGGATVKDWLDNGAASISADPAGSLVDLVEYRRNDNDDWIFNASDRDRVITRDLNFRRPYGIGVITRELRGRSTRPSEIGYYSRLGESDQLTVELRQPITNVQSTVSFFYSDERNAPEGLLYQAYYRDQPVYSAPVEVRASGTGAYHRGNAGVFTFSLAEDGSGPVKIDRIVFSAASDPNVIDGSDYLLENITGQGIPQLEISDPVAPDLVWPARTYTFNYSLANTGSGDAPAHSTGFFLSTDENLDAGDTFLGSSAENPIPAGTSRDTSATITLPDNLAIGNYYLIYQSDYTNVVDELNESNTANLGSPLDTGSTVAEPIQMNGYVRRDFDLNYSLIDESVFGIPTIRYDDFLGATWDVDEIDVPVVDIGIPGIPDFLGASAGISASTSGRIGLQPDVVVDAGSVNAALPIDLWLDVPNLVQAGETITIKSGFDLNPSARFSTTSPEASVRLDAIFDAYLWLSAFAEIDYIFDSERGDIELFDDRITEEYNLIDLELNPDDPSLDINQFWGGIDVSAPNLRSSSDYDGGVLTSEASDDFVTANVDVAGIIASFFGIPLSGDFSILGLDGSYSVLSAGIEGNLSVNQDLELSPERLAGQLTLENGDTHSFTVGQDLTFTVPEDIDESLDFTVALNLDADLTNRTSLGFDIGAYIEALSASIEGEGLGPLLPRTYYPFIDTELPPLYDRTLDVTASEAQTFSYSIPAFTGIV